MSQARRWTSPCPAVVTVHDISFEAHPEWFPRRQALRRRQTCRRACRSARLVLTISEFSRSELISRYHLPPERVVSVPLAADRRFQPEEQPSAEGRLRRELGRCAKRTLSEVQIELRQAEQKAEAREVLLL